MNKTRWQVLGVIVLALFGYCILLKNMNVFTSSLHFKAQGMCTPGQVASRASLVISNYSRNHSVFLGLGDFFWETTQSKFPLPYGTKGSAMGGQLSSSMDTMEVYVATQGQDVLSAEYHSNDKGKNVSEKKKTQYWSTENLLNEVLAIARDYHIPQKIKRLQCKRCIVVGSGYSLKNSSLGDIIDTYDIVIRLNHAPVHKYEKDVGSKTTLRFFYPESAFFDPVLDNNPDTLLVLVPFKNPDIQWLKTMLNDEKRINSTFWMKPPIIWNLKYQDIRILNPYFMQIAATKLLGFTENYNKRPTTGFMAISFAIHFCDLVHIAGFGYPNFNDTQPIHYFDKSTMGGLRLSAHKFPLEAMAIRNLLQNNVIQNLTYV